MEFRILGPLEIRDGERALPLGGVKRRSVVGALLLHANRVVAAEQLVDVVWGDDPPASAAGSLQNHVMRLRRELGDRVVTRAPGYLVRVEPGELDLDRFRTLLEAARSAAPTEAVALLDEGLALWRGDPLADLADEPLAMAASHLQELRLESLELRNDAQLALGRHAAVLPEIEALVRDHPFRERFRAQLLLALYRSGRQADALEAYASTRATFVEELGAEPGVELQELHRSILNHDASIAPPPRSPAAEPRVARAEARKTVTILLAELAVTAQDPETRRDELRRLQRDATIVLADHGGEPGRTSDTRVLGIFGIPAAREDDAFRAVQAACALRSAGLVVRAGIATGDVITGDPAAGSPRVSGPPLEEADRMLAAAPASDLLAADRTWRLVRHAVRGEPRAGGHAIDRVLDEADPLVRRLETPLVGREHELEEIDAALRRAIRDNRARLVTVFGSPGVGKTRLAREVVARVGGSATCLLARTPASGTAPTFAPLRDAFAGVAGNDLAGWVEQVLAGERDGEAATAIIAASVGTAGPGVPVEETAWATRRLVETLSRSQPVILVLEDLHWASPPLLDLVEHIAELARGPILLLALARPDLLETRPEWAGGRLNAATLLLEPLPPDQAEALLNTLTADAAVDAGVRSSILASAAGHPLFLEQLLAAALEGDVGGVPDSIHALLAARLDRLDGAELEVAQAAAVYGQRFPVDLVQELVERDVQPALRSLARRDLVEPEAAGALGEETWTFRHVLVRDEAYAGIPKRRRAALHQAIAAVLDERASAAGMDADELVGFHLEAAYHATADVDPGAPDLPDLAHAAAKRLAAAGVRAWNGELDVRGAAQLLGRAQALLAPDAPERISFAPKLASALASLDDREEAQRVLDAADAGLDPADTLARTRLLVARRFIGLWGGGGTPSTDEIIAEMDEAIPLLEAAGDLETLAGAQIVAHQAWERYGDLGWFGDRSYLPRAVDTARAAGVRAVESSAVSWLNVIVRRGPWPMDEARQIVQTSIDLPPTRFAWASALGALAILEAMEGRFDEARRLAAESNAIFAEAGLRQNAAADLINVADVEIIAGDLEAAEAILRDAIERLDALDDGFSMLNAAWRLALVLARRGREDEAAAFLARVDEVDAGLAVATWRDIVAATLAARKGEAESARRLLDRMDELLMRSTAALVADMLLQSADASELLGDRPGAVRHLERAASIAADLGYVVAERHARNRLASLGAGAGPSELVADSH